MTSLDTEQQDAPWRGGGAGEKLKGRVAFVTGERGASARRSARASETSRQL